MKPLPLLLLTIGLILTAGCSALSGTLEVDSDPPDAAVYLDGEYRGNTPCTVRDLDAGSHMLELRHERYPAWQTEVEMKLGEEAGVIADLAENLVPEVALACEGSGDHLRGEEIVVTGHAVTPWKQVNLSVEAIDGDGSFAPRSYQVEVDDEYNFEYRLPTDSMPGGRYRLSARLGTGETENLTVTVLTEGEANVAVVREIVETYRETHTYSDADFFVCADMALDVWNMIETRGIGAKIAIGDVERTGEELPEADHAWVLAETSPGVWTALETTGGFVVVDDEQYLEGWSFDTPRAFKEYIDLSNRYNAATENYKDTERRYNRKVEEYNNEAEYLEYLVDSYNDRYVGRSLTSVEYRTAQDMKKSIDEMKIDVAELNGELGQLSRELEGVEQDMEALERQMRRLAERIGR
ncbi:PEGA domain-containing protein [Methanofollis aquaemaris]|uniref:PEGA domain-containing protein n=1 Tax=Methanofollis aquaemaris TaxID=126734 RepID=A0A8A3S701_9EURY|nr:PEGA domain-containing protein [Methanofollis aquaemaris]QSZ67511.1 PEGA domain-containing protein [Methanofollis aquaemaris]